MARYTDIDATIGGSAANSWVTGLDMDNFAGLQSWGDVWLAKSEAERTVSILQACSWLQTVSYGGVRCSPSVDDSALPQALVWPRSGVTCDGLEALCGFIPAEVKKAQMLLAYQLVMSPDAITGAPGGGGGAAAGTFVSKQQLGSLVQEFSEYSNTENAVANDCSDCSNPEVINKFPWLSGILGCWAQISSGGGSKVLLRVRS